MPALLVVLILLAKLAFASNEPLFDVDNIALCNPDQQNAFHCTGNPAPSWVNDSGFRGVWLFEDRPLWTNQVATDSSPSGNTLTGFATYGDVLNFTQGCQSYAGNGASGSYLDCSGGCTPAQFQFTASDFTAGMYFRSHTYPGVGPISGESIELATVTIFAGGGWAMTTYQDGVSGPYKFGFYINDGSTIFNLQSDTSWVKDTWYHRAIRYIFAGGIQEQFVNGSKEATTASLTNAPPNTGKFGYGQFAPNRTLNTSFHDEAWVYNGALSDESICRIAVCGIDGCGCSCSGSAYTFAPRHISHGGPLTCTLPACDQGSPGVATTTSTTTSTSTSSTTSTSSSTSSTTSTSTTTTTSTSTTTTTLGDSTSLLMVPAFGGHVDQGTGTADRLYCFKIVPKLSISGATSITAGFSGAGTAVCGLGIYQDSDADAATVIASGSGSCTTRTAVRVSGLSSFILFGGKLGTQYRFCFCSSVTQNIEAMYGSAHTLSLAFTSTMQGFATTTCTAGVPPDRTKTLTGSNVNIPYMLVE